MTSPDFTDGYRTATRYYQNRAAQSGKAIDAWTDPDAQKVQHLVRKHWPRLAVALDLMRDSR